MKVFEIEIEFDRNKLHRCINDSIHDGRKGYVCFADANVLSIARKDETYLNILQGAMINSCDGGSVAMIINRIHGTDVRAYNGPDLFEDYIGRSGFKQLLLGNTEEKFQLIVEELKHRRLSCDHVSHLPVPFANVGDFDFKAIAEQVNEADADIIWVSLGAPKQEKFMAKLLPYINRGVMLGIGAAFNFYIGEIKQPRIHLGAFRFIWLDRIYREPKKQLKRVWKILKAMPLLYWDERERYKASLR